MQRWYVQAASLHRINRSAKSKAHENIYIYIFNLFKLLNTTYRDYFLISLNFAAEVSLKSLISTAFRESLISMGLKSFLKRLFRLHIFGFHIENLTKLHTKEKMLVYKLYKLNLYSLGMLCTQ